MNVGELKTQLVAWAKRGDLTDIPLNDIILNASNRIRREMMPQSLDQAVSINTTAAVAVRGAVWAHDLPDDCQKVWGLTNNGTRLRTVRSDALLTNYSRATSNTPAFYANVGKKIWTAPGAGGDLLLIYTAADLAIDPASDVSTNFGMDEFPDAYLWASLSGIAAYSEGAADEEQAHDRRYVRIAQNYNRIQMQRRRGGGATGVS